MHMTQTQASTLAKASASLQHIELKAVENVLASISAAFTTQIRPGPHEADESELHEMNAHLMARMCAK